MSYPNSPVLQLPVPDTAAVPSDYGDKVANDQALSQSLSIVDLFAANVTGSCFDQFGPMASGSVLDLNIGGTDQAAGVLGVLFNRASDRVVQEVIGLVSASGSNPAGVVRVDVQIQQGSVQPANFSSIFSNNTFKLAVSGSNGFVSKASTFVSGSNMVWPKGTAMRVVADATSGVAAGLGAMRGLAVQVFWKPSGSYGA